MQLPLDFELHREWYPWRRMHPPLSHERDEPLATKLQLELEYCFTDRRNSYFGPQFIWGEGCQWKWERGEWVWTWKEDKKLEQLRNDPDQCDVPAFGHGLTRLGYKLCCHQLGSRGLLTKRDERRVREATQCHNRRTFVPWAPNPQVSLSRS